MLVARQSQEPQCLGHMLSVWTAFPSKLSDAVGMLICSVKTQDAVLDSKRSRVTHQTSARLSPLYIGV